MKYIDYLVFIMGLTAGTFTFFISTDEPTFPLFAGFAFTLVMYSSMNINERSRSEIGQ